MALGKVGDALWNPVGREPSGTAFNSIAPWSSGLDDNGNSKLGTRALE
jgi:glutaminase